MRPGGPDRPEKIVLTRPSLALMGEDERLRAVVELAQAMAGAQRFCEAHPRHSTLREVAHAAAQRACAGMNAAFAALSAWDRARGRLDVLVNVGELAPGEQEFPEDESYPVHDFPEITEPLPERWAADGAEEPLAWIETAEGEGRERPGRSGAAPRNARVAALRRRGRGCCVVAPIVLRGRAWGELYVARRSGAPVFDRSDAHFAAVLAEIIAAGIAQNEQLEEVRRLAYTDQLTGLANRRAIEGKLDDGLERHREDGTVVSLVVCDLNGLKRVNDEQGHAAGDRLLERFGMVLSMSGAKLPGALAARLGGDEFCLLTVGPPADQVVRAAEEVCRNALGLRGGDGVSCGVASTGDRIGRIRSAARLFRLADAAQYRAKAARALGPVVAGRRGGTEDPVVRLADASEAEEAAAAAPPAGDRRHFRGHTPKPDEAPDEAGVRETGEGGQQHPPDVQGRQDTHPRGGEAQDREGDEVRDRQGERDAAQDRDSQGRNPQAGEAGEAEGRRPGPADPPDRHIRTERPDESAAVRGLRTDGTDSSRGPSRRHSIDPSRDSRPPDRQGPRVRSHGA
ncbi:diguanylate cyclase (GGDEF) domain-containing protein [Streptomyces sp. WMMB 322]|nr:diguanylate cyclase (GGDEF) domain-containing protein [Streptomyces sp. WMMB 322]